jgi:hypothetical protein
MTVTTPIPPDLARQVRDIPRWHYPGAGKTEPGGTVRLDHRSGGTCQLRVFDVLAGGWVAVVTELGDGASIAQAAPAIRQVLAGLLPGPLWLIEQLPAGHDPFIGEHLYLHPQAGGPAHLWPASPADPHHDQLDQWMTRNGPAILGRPVPDPAAFIRSILDGGGDPWPGETFRCPACNGTGIVMMRGAACHGYDEPDFPDTCGICGGNRVMPVSMLNPYPDPSEASEDTNDEGTADLDMAHLEL